MTRIWEKVYLGSLKDAEQLVNSNSISIASVVSLCEEAVIHQTEMVTYAHIPIFESSPLSARKFNDVISAIAKYVRHGKVLVHCAAGMSRSPILVATWLHRCGYAELSSALREISQAREIDPSPILLRSIGEHLRR
jgi:protein-tyrosine phosphatase